MRYFFFGLLNKKNVIETYVIQGDHSKFLPSLYKISFFLGGGKNLNITLYFALQKQQSNLCAGTVVVDHQWII